MQVHHILPGRQLSFPKFFSSEVPKFFTPRPDPNRYEAKEAPAQASKKTGFLYKGAINTEQKTDTMAQH